MELTKQPMAGTTIAFNNAALVMVIVAKPSMTLISDRPARLAAQMPLDYRASAGFLFDLRRSAGVSEWIQSDAASISFNFDMAGPHPRYHPSMSPRPQDRRSATPPG
jgi:hypothetical protein